jgi:hypothetical protein
MTILTLRNKKVESVFDLLGENENAMTSSLGFALSECKIFLNELAKMLGAERDFSDNVKIKLQEYRDQKGFTDLEIIDPGFYHIIIEAKRGFVLPEEEQLKKYADRLINNGDDRAIKLLVILAESDRADKWLDSASPKEINGVSIKNISWKKFRSMATKIQNDHRSSHAQKRLLGQLIIYLNKVTMLQNENSNLVYVVSLSSSNFSDADISFIDVVEKYKKYFHPVGGTSSGWPSEPPNYIAFRYKGALQAIHHIESYRIIDDYSPYFPVPTKIEATCLYLYELGEKIVPPKPTPTNDPDKNSKYPDLFRSARKWCFIDLLLTSGSIAEAVCKTLERKNINK